MFELDPGDPGQSQALERLSTHTIAWLTTVSPAGTPQPSAVWFWWDGETVLVFSADSVRVRNIAANPRVAVHFNTDEYGDEISILYGLAAVDPEAPPAKEIGGYRARYEQRLPLLGMDWESFSSHYHLPVRIALTGYRRW